MILLNDIIIMVNQSICLCYYVPFEGYRIPDNRGLTVINPAALTRNYYITEELSLPSFDWTICFWANFSGSNTYTTLVSMASSSKPIEKAIKFELCYASRFSSVVP